MKTNKVPHKAMHPQLQKLDNKLKHAAQLYEKQFLRQMVKAMRDSVSHSAMTKPGMAEKIYSDQLDDKYVDSWVDSGGTGFSDIIYRELVDKYYPQLGAKKGFKNVRPANLSDRYQGISRSLTQAKTKKHTFNIQLGEQTTTGKSYLQLPWKAKFEKAFQLPHGGQVAEFSYSHGLKSTFVFKGSIEPRLLHKTLSEGENFAQLSSESQSLTWQIQDANSRKDSSVEENKSFN